MFHVHFVLPLENTSTKGLVTNFFNYTVCTCLNISTAFLVTMV